MVVNAKEKFQYNPLYIEQLKLEMTPIVIEAITRGVDIQAINDIIKDIQASIVGGNHG